MSAEFFLGIDGGGTRTVALLADKNGKILQRRETIASNLRMRTDAELLKIFRVLDPKPRKKISRIAICMAGALLPRDFQRVQRLAAKIWPRVPCLTVADTESALRAATGNGVGIVIIAGTGSNVFGRNACGQTAKAGGWGNILGDVGSAHWFALQTLRRALRELDRTGKPNRALQKTLRKLCLNSPDELPSWITSVPKTEIAALAPEIFGENRELLDEAAEHFAESARVVAKKLQLRAPKVALSGGVFSNQPRFFAQVRRKIRQKLQRARVIRPKFEPACGALMLAMNSARAFSRIEPRENRRDLAAALTEARNPRTMDLHKRSVSRLIDTMLDEEKRVVPAIRAQKKSIERAVNVIISSFKRGGRLFYVGAGTSGRLGVLDASECPPTFSTSPEMVQGIIAGGVAALHSAVEAAEDDPLAGAEAIGNRGVNKKDVVVGIAASGSTPFVLGALDEAKRRGAKTFLLCFSAPRSARHAPLFIRTGPEVIAGSTRLKAGTATKIVLNMLTTISMIRIGKVVSNLMVDVKPNSEKLRDRACRIVATLRNCSIDEAKRRLIRANWNVKRALR
jgi:N-acetylmuramic acid 6-phosphate etherase